MKTQRIILLILVFKLQTSNFNLTLAQTPQAIPYQAVARDNAGNPLINQNISLRFSIHDEGAGGTVVYKETQTATTNALGLFTANIGQGNVIDGTFSTIEWGANIKFLQVEIDVSGGSNFTDMGTQQMLSVPYALQANSLSIPGTPGSNITALGCMSTNISSPEWIDVVGNYAYVSSSLNNRLCIYDISDPYNIIAKGFTSINLLSPSTVKVVGNYAYVASPGNNRLCIFDISDPNNIVAKGFSTTNMDGPNDVFILGNLAYVSSNVNSRLCIFDISDPMNIIAKGFTNTNLSHPWAVFVSGNYAYVASNTNSRLCIYDISNPNSIIAKAFTSANILNPIALYVSGNFCYVASAGNNNFSIFDISDPNNIITKGFTNTNLLTPRSIVVIGNFAYVISAGNNRLYIFDISDPNNIVAKGFTSSNLSSPKSLAISGNNAYVTSLSSNQFCIFNLTEGKIIIQKPDGSLSSVSQSWEYGTGDFIHNLNSGNVGIGTISPASKLEVAGKTTTTTFQMTTGGAAGNVLTSDASGNGTWTPSTSLSITETDPQVSSATTNQVAKWNGTTLVDGGITDDGTNVGIGTSLPEFKFDLKHSGNAMSGTNVDVSELGMKIGNTDETIGTAVGMGFGKSAAPGNIGGAIIFERTGSQSIGRMHFATKSSPVSSEDIPIRMTITNTGNVGIGCTTPQYKLHVIGDIASSATVRTTNVLATGAITACSDIRFKKQITPLQNSLEKILQLQGVNYFWKTKEFPDRYFNEINQIGLIAQEVEKIFPELVVTDKDGFKSVDYSKLTPILVEAIKELKAENSSLKSSLDNLQTQTAEKLKVLEAKLNLLMNISVAATNK